METDPPPCQDQNSRSDDRITVRIPEAIRLTGLGRSKIYELIASEDIEVVKIGRCTLVKVDSIYRLINQAHQAKLSRFDLKK